MTFTLFTDRDLGKKFPEVLAQAGLDVKRHQDHFVHDTPDEVWLEEIGGRGWVAITHDQRIRYKPNELDAVTRHRVALLVVIGKAPYPELAKAFVDSWPRIEKFLRKHSPPYIAKIYRPSSSDLERGSTAGRVELSYPKTTSTGQ